MGFANAFSCVLEVYFLKIFPAQALGNASANASAKWSKVFSGERCRENLRFSRHKNQAHCPRFPLQTLCNTLLEFVLRSSNNSTIKVYYFSNLTKQIQIMAIYLPVPGHARPSTDFLSAVLHQLSQYGCSNIFKIYLSSNNFIWSVFNIFCFECLKHQFITLNSLTIF